MTRRQKELAPGQVRPVHKRTVYPNPQAVAERLERIRRGREKYLVQQTAIRALAKDPTAMASLPLDQIRQYMTKREYEVAMLFLGHYTFQGIADCAGYKTKQQIALMLKKPAVRRFVELVEAAQLDRVINGEFGVRAQARAAGPRVMAKVIEKAGGKEGGHAARDSDLIRAADLVLTVSGEKVARSEHHHVHELIRSLSQDELRKLAEHNEWPERLKPLIEGPPPEKAS